MNAFVDACACICMCMCLCACVFGLCRRTSSLQHQLEEGDESPLEVQVRAHDQEADLELVQRLGRVAAPQRLRDQGLQVEGAQNPELLLRQVIREKVRREKE